MSDKRWRKRLRRRSGARAGNPDDGLRLRSVPVRAVAEAARLSHLDLRLPHRRRTARNSSNWPMACARSGRTRSRASSTAGSTIPISKCSRTGWRSGTRPRTTSSFASGMAAISTTLWAYARPGSVIVHSGPVYGGTDFLLKRILPQFGVTPIEFPGGGRGEARWRRRSTGRARMGPVAALYLETPANPTNGLVDIGRAQATGRGSRRRRRDSARSSSSTTRCSDPCTRRRSPTAPIWS